MGDIVSQSDWRNRRRRSDKYGNADLGPPYRAWTGPNFSLIAFCFPARIGAGRHGGTLSPSVSLIARPESFETNLKVLEIADKIAERRSYLLANGPAGLLPVYT